MHLEFNEMVTREKCIYSNDSKENVCIHRSAAYYVILLWFGKKVYFPHKRSRVRQGCKVRHKCPDQN